MYLLNLPTEVIVSIFRQLDLDGDAYGGAGLALTCKHLAKISRMVKVNRTKRLVKHLGWLGGGAWCDGCDKVKSLSKEYWDEAMPGLKTQWLPTSVYVLGR